jgi:peptidoglycan hydrolase-like protein with peptidoglycan-binding domain
MSTIAASTSASRSRPLVVLAALAFAALPPVGAALAAPESEAAAAAVAAAQDLPEPDGPEVDEERLVDLVADAQRRLRLSGYDPGPIDGRMGLRTQRAIRAYQAAARRGGTLEALKGPARDDAAPRPEVVGLERAAPSLTR